MIFPNDVHKRIQNQNKIAGQNKTQLIITIFVLGNIACFFALNWIFNSLLMLPVSAILPTQLGIMVIVGILVFRFAIFNEEEKKREYKGYESDSFAKYMYLRKDVQNEISIGENRSVHLFEYVNGTATCTLEFKFGSNDDVRAKHSRRVFQQIIHAALSAGFEYRVVVTPEDFKKAVEFKKHIDKVNKIPDVNLRKSNMRVSDGIMEECYKVCNVDVVYISFRSQTNYQKNDLEALIRNITAILANSTTAFRSVNFLNIEELLEFYREFYLISAIDLAMMKTIELAKEIDDDFTNVIKLYSVTDDNGKTFRVNKIEDNLFQVSERRLND